MEDGKILLSKLLKCSTLQGAVVYAATVRNRTARLCLNIALLVLASGVTAFGHGEKMYAIPVFGGHVIALFGVAAFLSFWARSKLIRAAIFCIVACSIFLTWMILSGSVAPTNLSPAILFAVGAVVPLVVCAVICMLLRGPGSGR